MTLVVTLATKDCYFGDMFLAELLSFRPSHQLNDQRASRSRWSHRETAEGVCQGSLKSGIGIICQKDTIGHNMVIWYVYIQYINKQISHNLSIQIHYSFWHVSICRATPNMCHKGRTEASRTEARRIACLTPILCMCKDMAQESLLSRLDSGKLESRKTS